MSSEPTYGQWVEILARFKYAHGHTSQVWILRAVSRWENQEPVIRENGEWIKPLRWRHVANELVQRDKPVSAPVTKAKVLPEKAGHVYGIEAERQALIETLRDAEVSDE